MNELYTASEAIKRLGIPRSTFYYLVDKGEIAKVLLPLRKQAYYDKTAIDALAESKGREEADLKSDPESFVFKIPTKAEILQLIKIDEIIWGEVGVLDPSTILDRIQYNPEYLHALVDRKTGEACAAISMTRLPEETLQKLLQLQMDESQIQAEECLPYQKETPQDCYVTTVVTRPDLHSKFYGSRILLYTFSYLLGLVEQGIIIRRIYAVANTEEGLTLSTKLGFTTIQQGIGPLGDERTSVMLDLEDSEARATFVKRYQLAVKNRTRRAQRQMRRQFREVDPSTHQAGTEATILQYLDEKLEAIKQEIIEEVVKHVLNALERERKQPRAM